MSKDIKNVVSSNMTASQYCKQSQKIILSEKYKLPENYLDLMVKVNKMVKDKTCPNNLKNRFYSRKKAIIKKCFEEGRINEIYDEDKVISLVIDNEYCFHQLKESFVGQNGKIIGSREYINKTESIPLDENIYREFELAAFYYLGKK